MNWTKEEICRSWREFSKDAVSKEIADRVEERLVAGIELYENRLLNSADAEAFKKNFEEEMFDAAAYLWMLATVDGRTTGLRCLLDDVGFVCETVRDAGPNLGYAVGSAMKRIEIIGKADSKIAIDKDDAKAIREALAVRGEK